MISPMLATLGTATDIDENDEPWAFEMKWDGIRAVTTVGADKVDVRTRNGIDVSRTFPELSELVGHVAPGTVLDGEIVALNKKGRPDFGLLQQHTTPATYMIFDLLTVGNRSVTDLSYDERRARLLAEVKSTGRIQVPEAFEGNLAAAMEASRRLALEGVVAKKRDSTYSPGRRSRAWIKLKHHKTQEVVVGGWRPGSGRRSDSIGSLLLGIPTTDGLEYVGRVGTGFRDADLHELTTTLRGLETTTNPFVAVDRAISRDAHWVSPTLVGEVEFAEWTAFGKLRQPSWRGWRTDKDVADVVREGD